MADRALRSRDCIAALSPADDKYLHLADIPRPAASADVVENQIHETPSAEWVQRDFDMNLPVGP